MCSITHVSKNLSLLTSAGNRYTHSLCFSSSTGGCEEQNRYWVNQTHLRIEPEHCDTMDGQSHRWSLFSAMKS